MPKPIFKSPLISIVTPTYNCSQFITETINSVLAQTYKNFEMIIIDDGSTDNTEALVQEYLKDNRIIYLQQENSGQAIARNKGIQHAKGEYICFLDSDDYWRSDLLKKTLAIFNANPEVSIVYSDGISVNEDSEEISRYNIKGFSGYIAPLLLRDNFISMSTTMVKRACFDRVVGFDEKCRRADDYQLWLRMSVNCYFHHIPEYLGFYRERDGQLSSNKQLRFDANEKIIREFLSEYPAAVTWQSKRRGLSHFHTRKANYLLSEKKYGPVIQNILKAIFYHPFWTGPWRTFALIFLNLLHLRRD